MRHLYQKARGWKQIFQDPRHFAFDEYIRTTHSISIGGVQSFSDLVFSSNDISISNDKYIGYENRPQKVTFDRGRIYVEGKEYIFFHYVVAKQSVFWTTPEWDYVPDKFYINKYGFYLPGDHPVRFIDLLYKSPYRSQLVSAIRKKTVTIKRIVRRCDIKSLFKSILKQFN